MQQFRGCLGVSIYVHNLRMYFVLFIEKDVWELGYENNSKDGFCCYFQRRVFGSQEWYQTRQTRSAAAALTEVNSEAISFSDFLNIFTFFFGHTLKNKRCLSNIGIDEYRCQYAIDIREVSMMKHCTVSMAVGAFVIYRSSDIYER